VPKTKYPVMPFNLDRRQFPFSFSKFSYYGVLATALLSIFILQAAGALAQAPNISYTTPQVYATGNAITNLTPSNSGGAIPTLTFRNVTTYAGSGSDGSTPTNNANPLLATFNDIVSMVMDAKGNMYIAESYNGRIRKVAANGTVTTLMDISGADYTVKGIEINSSTGDLYFSVVNHAIYRIPNTNSANYPTQDPTYTGPTDGTASSYLMAGLRGTSGTTDNATGTSARFNAPLGMDVDAANGFMYVVEYSANRIRKISLTSPYAVTTVSTSGVSISQPEDVVVDATGVLYVTSASANVVYRIGTDGVVTNFAGSGTAGYLDGQGTAARLNDPRGIDMDADGNIYVADGAGSHTIRKISTTGYVSTLAGSGTGLSGTAEGVGTSARFNTPWDVMVDRTNNLLFVADNSNDKVREIEIGGYTVWPSLPEGLSMSATTGVISGTPLVRSRQVYYADDFDDAAGGSGASIAGHAAYTGGWMRLTDAENNQDGAFKVDPSGVNTNGLQVDFKFITGKTSGGADGMSYSFSSDAVITGGDWVVLGTGTGLSLSFVTFSGNTIKTNLYYGSGRTNATSVTGTLLASNTSSNALWLGRTANVSLTIDNDGKVTVKVDGNTVFNQVQLPAGYAAADKSTWHHVFRARTGGSNDVHAIDDLVIRQSLGAADHTVTGYNASGAASTTLNVTVLNPPTLTTTSVSSNTTGFSLSSGGNITTDGGSAVTARGVIWSTSSGPTVSLSTKTTDGTGTGTFTSSVTGLTPNTTYYLRAYATTAAGTGYGNEVSFTTPQVAPSISYTTSSYTLVRNSTMTPIPITNAGGTPDKVQVSTLAGTGSATFANGIGRSASFSYPNGVWVDGSGILYVADGGNHRIRKMTISTGVVETLAGSGSAGFANGIGATASFNDPFGIVGDGNGNLFVVDVNNHRIRKVVISTGEVSSVAGSGSTGSTNGTGTSATFAFPQGIALDGSGNLVIADYTNGLIRKMTPGGSVSTVAGTGFAGAVNGTGTGASFNGPHGVAVDAAGNMYVAEGLNHLLRRITPGGVVTTLAGSGIAGFTNASGTASAFNAPRGVAIGPDGNIYMADYTNRRIRMITSSGVVTTFAGSGTAGNAEGTVTTASFFTPGGIAFDASGHLYVTDFVGQLVRIIAGYRISPALPAGLYFDPRTGTISGTPTTAQAAKTFTVYSQNSAGTSQTTITIGIADAPTVITNAATNVTATTATLSGTVNANGGATSALTIKYSTSQATVDAGNGTSATVSPTSASGNIVTAVSAAITGLTASATYYYRVSATNTAGTTNGTTLSFTTAAPPPNISYSGSPVALSVGTAMSAMSPANSGGTPTPMQVSKFAGSTAGFADGLGTAAKFYGPAGLAIDGSGSLYVADRNNYRIRKVLLSTGMVTTFAGSATFGSSDGVGAAATFSMPFDLVIDGSGFMYISEEGNHAVRKLRLSDAQVNILAGGTSGFSDGTGTAAKFHRPMGLTADNSGNLYQADAWNQRIRKIESSSGVVTSISNGVAGYLDGPISTAKFRIVTSLDWESTGILYVVDAISHVIRKIDLNASPVAVTTLAGSGNSGNADGIGTAASFKNPLFIKLDGNGNLYVSEWHRIRKIRLSDGKVTTVAGSESIGDIDGTGTSARFSNPHDIEVDANGNLFVADYNNNCIRIISNYSISPALPAGLSFNTATGEVSGTPSALSSSKTYTVTASNEGGTSTATFTLEVTSSLLTTDVSAISSTTATSGGTVDATAYAGATQKGVCWNTSGTPTIADGKTLDGSGTGTFTSSLSGLTANTTYYLRSYVTVGGVTSYGSEKTFKTNRSMTISPVSKTYGDAPFAIAAPTSNSTGTWSYASGTTSVATISGSTVTIVGAGSSIITATQAAAGAYAATSITFTLTVNPATPTITLNIPNTTTLAAANNMAITATSSNGEPVTIAIGSGTATGTLTGSPGSFLLNSVSSTGNLVFNASTSATATHAAGSKTVIMNVQKNNQTITFNALTAVSFTTGMTQSLTASSSSGEAVSFAAVSGPGSVAGSTLTITGPGSILIRASQAGNGTFNPAPDVERTLTVNPSAPVITSFTPTSATEGDVVTITGQYFDNASAVSFGATAATSFTVVNSTTITAVVGTGHTGVVSVTTTGGTDTETGFRYKVMWTGATNDFTSTGNWSGGRVPQTDDDIIFSATAASDLELDGNKTVGHVNFNGSGRSLKLGTHNLTIKGNLTMPGNIAGTGRVIMNGGSAQTIIGGGDIPDLEINNSTGVSIDAAGDELTVSGTLISTAGTLTTNGKLRLTSNSGGTARVGVVTGTITGDVIAERYVKRNENSDGTGRAWRLVSVPVTGTGILRDFFMNGRSGQDLTLSASRDAETDNSGTPIVGHNYTTASDATTAGFDWIGVANSVSSLRSYVGDAGGGTFLSENVPSLSTTYAAAAQGYMVFTRGDRKLDFPNATSSGPTTFRSTGNLKTGTQTVSVDPAATSKFTLVGNPYMSVLDLDAFYTTNSAVINPSFWIWEANMAGTNNQGGYINVYKSGTQWVTNTGSYIDPQLIESGMAFFVEPVSSLSTATNINITEAHKSAASTAGLSPFATDLSDDHGRLYVRLERADAKGQRQLIDGVMADFHPSFKTTLGDLSDREKLRNGISRGALWLTTEQKILSSEGLPWPTETKRSIPLYMSGVGDQTLIVRVDPRGMRDRYVQAWLKDNVLKRQIEINMNAPTDYDFIGTGSATWDSTRFEIVYVEAGRPSTGVTLEPDDAAEQPSVKLYPNPSKSSDVKLSLRAMAPGTYSVYVLDMTGRLVATTSLQHRSVNGEYRILEGRLLSPGKYLIRLSQSGTPVQTLQLIHE
jgi:hypothetical protein